MEDRKAQIIQVATSLIKQYGYDSFSYKDLSEAVGITKATLHHHFAKKEDLGIALLQLIEEQLNHLKQKVLEIKDPSDQLVFMFSGMKSLLNSGDICPISSMQAEYNVVPKSLRIMVAKISQMEIDLLTLILNNGKQSGRLVYEGKAETIALMMMTSYKGSIMYARTLDQPIIDVVIKSMIEHIVE